MNAALAHAWARALHDRARHRERIARFADPDGVVAAVREAAVITLNFHPDRLLRDGRSVVEGLLEDGAYHNQFKTGGSARVKARCPDRSVRARTAAGSTPPRWCGLSAAVLRV